MGEKTKVALVILNFNRKRDTLECLDSGKKLHSKYIDLLTFVVDNGSTDASVRDIKKQFPEVKLIENHRNLGFCEGNNVGAKAAFAAGADYVIILNNDTLLHPLMVEELVKTTQQEKAGVASPKIYFAQGFEFHKDRYTQEEQGKVIWYAGGHIDWKNVWPSHRGVDEVDHGQYDKVEDTMFATGCATLLSKEVYARLGLYDPRYVFYFEDLDFSLRAQQSGFRIIYAPQAKLWHKNAASFGGSGSPFQDYFITRNRLLFGLRYASPRAKLALLREAARFFIQGSPIKRKAVIDALLRRIPKIEDVR